MSNLNVVIIGGGVTGCSIAYHLAKHGVVSQIIERDAIASQASGKAWGCVSSPASILLFYEGHRTPKGSMRPCLSFFVEGLRRFPQLAQELREEGGLDIGYGELHPIRVIFQENEGKYLRERVSELNKEGFEASWIDGKDVRARFPSINPTIFGGVFLPGHQVESYRYVLALLQAAEAKGVSIKQGEAVGFRHQGSKVTGVTLTSGEVKADVFVLATGPWTGQGTSWLGKKLPMTVTREHCLRIRAPQRLPSYRLYSSEVAIVPKVDGTVILGPIIYDVVTGFEDMPTEDARLKTMEDAVSLMPNLKEAELIEHSAGIECWQPGGGLPMLGRLPAWDNVYLATWTGPFGIQWSPAVGRIMADLIVNGKNAEAEPFDPAKNVK